MSREWKPGDVAVVEFALDERGRKFHGPAMFCRGGWMTEAAWSVDAEVIRPLVVIDPEDREQVERLLAVMKDRGWTGLDGEASVDMQAALREFANPKPVEVFEHFVIADVVDGIHKSMCGKVWRPSDKTVAKAKCPECTAVVESGWVR